VSEPLFREEAVEHLRRGRGGGDVVRVAPRWTAIAFWSLLTLAVAAVTAAAVIDVDRVRLVPAVAEAPTRTVRAVVPASDAPKPGTPAEFALTRTGDRTPIVIQRVGAPQSGAAPVVARATKPVAAGAGVLELKVGERPLLADLIPGSSSER